MSVDCRQWMRVRASVSKYQQPCIHDLVLGMIPCAFTPGINSTMAVSLAACEIFSVKEWCDLENWVRACSRSLKMSIYITTFYWSAIVSMALSSIISEKKRGISQKSRFSHIPLHFTPPVGVTIGVMPCRLVQKKLEWVPREQVPLTTVI